LVVAIRHRDDDAFVQSDNDLEVGPVGEGIEEADLERAGIGEDVLRAGGPNLFDEQVPTRTGYGAEPAVASSLRLDIGRVDDRSSRRGGESGRGELSQKATPRQLAVEVAVKQL